MARWPYAPVFAHRCGGVLAPENTLAGLDAASASGCGGVEFDVMLSGSGSPFLIHDETLERTTTGRGRVADSTDDDLLGLDAGHRFHPRFAGERIPTFSVAVARCIALGLHVNVEIKPSVGCDEDTGRIVAQHAAALWAGVEPAPLLSSFSEPALEAAARAAPSLPRGLLFDRVPPDWQARCTQLGVMALHANCRHLSRNIVASIREVGLWVVAYTENNPLRAQDLFDWGVDCVISDRPDRLARPG